MLNVFIAVLCVSLALSYATDSYEVGRERYTVLLFYLLAGLIVYFLAPHVPQTLALILSSTAPQMGHALAHTINMRLRRARIEGLMRDAQAN